MKGKRDTRMDFPIVVIIIAILLLIAALIWLTQIKLPEHQAMIYERRLKAEADYDAKILGAAKILTFQGVGYLTTGVSDRGKIEYQPIVITAEATAGKTIYDADEVAAHNDAVQLVSDSIEQNGKDSKKLLTADEWQALGHRRDDWQAATSWLQRNGLTQSRIGGANPGTFTTRRDLSDCMLALAIYGLPPHPNIVDNPVSAKAGITGT